MILSWDTWDIYILRQQTLANNTITPSIAKRLEHFGASVTLIQNEKAKPDELETYFKNTYNHGLLRHLLETNSSKMFKVIPQK